MAWLARWDLRAASWPVFARIAYRTVKWSLVALGAYCLVGVYIQRWGWAAGIWFLAAPVAWGVYQGLTGSKSP